ncbi:hypothetical protein Tco_0309456 [Tanacetum coccineum]
MIALVKVRWDSKRGPELTWEHKDQMRSKCPQLLPIVLMPRVVKSRDDIFSRWGYCDNCGLSSLPSFSAKVVEDKVVKPHELNNFASLSFRKKRGKTIGPADSIDHEVPYVPEAEYPEYLVPSDAETPLEDQPLPANASPTALSLGYVADSNPDEDPEEDPEEDHVDYPADGRDGDDEPSDDDDDDDTDDEDEEPFEDEDDDEEEEHLALADSSAIPIVNPVPSARDTEAFETDETAPTHVPSPKRHTARMSVRPQTPILLPSDALVERLLALPIPPPSPLSPWSSPLPQIPSPQLPPPPSSLHLPPPVPTSLPLPSSPLPPLPASLFIPPPVDHREDTPEAELLPRKRADYEFIGTMDAEIRRQRADEVGYGIRDVWVDPIEAVKEVAPTTLEGVNARVVELIAVQEQDPQDIYAVIGDNQDRQT